MMTFRVLTGSQDFAAGQAPELPSGSGMTEIRVFQRRTLERAVNGYLQGGEPDGPVGGQTERWYVRPGIRWIGGVSGVASRSSRGQEEPDGKPQ